jgi:hypothetical protein
MTIFEEQKQLINDLAELKHPTGNGKYTAFDFTKELTLIFETHGWSYAEYCDRVWSTQPVKKQATVTVTELESEVQKLATQFK